MEGTEPRINGYAKAKVIIEVRAGGMVTRENAEHWQQREDPVFRKKGNREVTGAQNHQSGVAVLLQRLSVASAGGRPEREAGSTRGVAGSDGLIVAHVPDLSSLGLLMQQCETSQVF